MSTHARVVSLAHGDRSVQIPLTKYNVEIVVSDNTENFIISREIDMGLCVYESEHECTRYCADFRIFSIFHEKYQQIFENSQLDYLRTDSSRV